jgi:ankyrin repeat protein
MSSRTDPNKQLISGAKRGSIRMVEQALANGADINARDNIRTGGHTALLNAVSENDVEMVKFLLEHGADPNVRTGRDYHITPILIVKSNECLEILLQHGANPNDKSISGISVLMGAFYEFKVGKFQLLLEYGAKISKQDFDTIKHSHLRPVRPFTPEIRQRVEDMYKIAMSHRIKQSMSSKRRTAKTYNKVSKIAQMSMSRKKIPLDLQNTIMSKLKTSKPVFDKLLNSDSPNYMRKTRKL